MKDKETGRMMDVLIEEHSYWRHDGDEKKKVFSHLDIWADADMKEVIESVEGVTDVVVDEERGATNYTVQVDMRYDRETIKKNIQNDIKFTTQIRKLAGLIDHANKLTQVRVVCKFDHES